MKKFKVGDIIKADEEPVESKIILLFEGDNQGSNLKIILIQNGKKTKSDSVRIPDIKGEMVNEVTELIYHTTLNNAKYYYGENADERT